MDRTSAIGLIFAIIVVGWILGTGQWAYGNVVGPLFNNSKLPKLEITYASAVNQGNRTVLILNITDVDGPDAYPATAPLMEIYNSTWHMFLNSSEISNDTIKIIQAPVERQQEGQRQLVQRVRNNPGLRGAVLGRASGKAVPRDVLREALHPRDLTEQGSDSYLHCYLIFSFFLFLQ